MNGMRREHTNGYDERAIQESERYELVQFWVSVCASVSRLSSYMKYRF
jgi:hypothetical protein